jgi:hypothetical protein
MRLPARSASGSSEPSHAPASSATAFVVVASSAATVAAARPTPAM